MNRIQIFNMDALKFMAKIPSAKVDVIITDPPYWTLDKWRNVGTTTRLGGHGDKDKQRPEMFFETIDREYLWDIFVESYRVLKPDGHLYIFCDDIVGPILCQFVREAQEKRFEDCHLLVWDKEAIGMGYHYRRRYEFILFAWKGKRKLRDLGKADVFRYKRIVNQYPTQKPPGLVQELVTQSARVGDVLCDPFAGSGVLGEATPCDYKCNILLNDKSPESLEWICGHLYEKAEAFTPGMVEFKWDDDIVEV
jgi:site-specific DNA-methyltransferase (adenine-specific)